MAGKPASEKRGRWAKRPRWQRRLIVAGGVVAAAAAVVLVLWFALVRRPDVSGNQGPGAEDGGDESPSLSGNAAGTDLSGRKEDYYTFLLIGKDTGGGGNTDTLILVSYDVPNQQVNMMSIPRDTAVNVTWSVKKINSVYMASEKNGGGIEGLKKQVGCLTGVTPDFYVIVEWKAVGEIVDAVGGVEFDVPQDMNYEDPYQDLYIHQTAGLRLLSGEDAMEVIRFRSYSDGDLGRVRVQQAFLKAMAKRVLQLGNIVKVGEFVRIFMDNVETDMQLSDLMWFASKALGMDSDTIQTCTMPGEAKNHRGGSYVFADVEELLALVNEQFDPYNRDVTEKDLQVMVRNQDGSVYVTNGELLDSRWASAYSSGGSSGSSVSSGGGSSDAPADASDGGTDAGDDTAGEDTAGDDTAGEDTTGEDTAGDGTAGDGTAGSGAEGDDTAGESGPDSDTGGGAEETVDAAGNADTGDAGAAEPELPDEPVLPEDQAT